MTLSHGFGAALLVDGVAISDDKVGLVIVRHMKLKGVVNFGFDFLRVYHAMRYHDICHDLIIWVRSGGNVDRISAKAVTRYRG